MRRTLARSRDTLIAGKLPKSATHTELNYRTRVTSNLEDILTVIRVILPIYVLLLGIAVAFFFLKAFGLFPSIWLFIPVAVGLLTLSLLRFLFPGPTLLREFAAFGLIIFALILVAMLARSMLTGLPLVWWFVLLLALPMLLSVLVAVFPVGVSVANLSPVATFALGIGTLGAVALCLTAVLFPGPLSAYLAAFGAALVITSVTSHLIAKQYAFFIIAGESVPLRTMRRWQRLWQVFPAIVAPKRVPELGKHTWSFAFLALAFAFGGAAVMFAQRRDGLDPFAGGLGILVFLVAVVAAHLVLNGVSRFGEQLSVSWRALRTFLVYNRHGARAAGLFLFPTSHLRKPVARDLLVTFSFAFVVLAGLALANDLTLPEIGKESAGAAKPEAKEALDPLELFRNLVPFKDTNPPEFEPRLFGEQLAPKALVPDVTLSQDPLTNATPAQIQIAKRLSPEERPAFWQRIAEEQRRSAEEQKAKAEQTKQAAEQQTRDERAFVMLTKLGTAFGLALLAPLLLFGLLVYTSSSILLAHRDALEGPEAWDIPMIIPASEQLARGAHISTAWDNRVERILNSKNAEERKHFYLGRSLHNDYPILLHEELLHRHAHFLGSSGAAKTSLGFAPLMTQIMAREKSSLLILDLKGDMSLFSCAMVEAAHAGLPFKWFTNVVGKTSFVFNPFTQSHVSTLTTNQQTQVTLQALSLDYGEDYGRGYYSAMMDIVLSVYLGQYPEIRSFQELKGLMDDPDSYRRIGNPKDKQEARALEAIVSLLSKIEPLNATETTHPEAFDEQIDLGTLLTKPQVVYFYLSAPLEPKTVSAVGKLALFALLSAAASGQVKDPNQVYLFVDECQRLLSQNLEIFFEQARSMKLAFILANQTAKQLQNKGVDLLEVIESCTSFKQLFTANDLETMKRLEMLSGEARYHTAAWEEVIVGGFNDERDNAFGMANARRYREANAGSVRVSEASGPRLEKNTIIEMSAEDLGSFVRFASGKGFTQYSGYITPIFSEYHIDGQEYEARKNFPWPPLDSQTIEIAAPRRSAQAATRVDTSVVEPESPTARNQQTTASTVDIVPPPGLTPEPDL